MGKSHGTPFHLWELLEITNTKPLPYPTNNVERVHVHSDFFASFNSV